MPDKARATAAAWDREKLALEIGERTGRLNAGAAEEGEADAASEAPEEQASEAAAKTAEPRAEIDHPEVEEEPAPGLAWEVIATAMLVAATLGGTAAVLLLRP